MTARTLWVSADGSDSASGLSPTTAWATMNHALSTGNSSRPVAGDTVNVMSRGGAFSGDFNFNLSGTPGLPITLDGFAGGWNSQNGYPVRATITQTDHLTGVIYVPGGTTDFVIRGFDLQGINASNQNGIYCAYGCQRFIIEKNRIHEIGGNGICVFQCDRVLIDKNIIYNNCRFPNTIKTSGITILGPTDLTWDTNIPSGGDARPTAKTVVSNNVIYGNYCVLASGQTSNSDGNGIIIDDPGNQYGLPGFQTFNYSGTSSFQSPASGLSPTTPFGNVAYQSKVLIYNNVIFGNGAAGIWSYLWTGCPSGAGMYAVHNTLYRNCQDPNFGRGHGSELGANQTDHCLFANNLIYTDGIASTHATPRCGIAFATSVGAVLRNNAVFNAAGGITTYFDSGSTGGSETGTIITNPQLIGATTNALTAQPEPWNPTGFDFRVASGSPVLGAGGSAWPVLVDILGHPRSPTAPTCGAYEQHG